MIEVPDDVKVLLEALWNAGYEACPVGGCVRDGLMGKSPADWDICTNALPEDIMDVFANFRTIKTGMRYGTVTVLSGVRPVEITTFRKEYGYSDGRRPDSVTFVRNLEEDLARRDFTVNAMALEKDGNVLDPFDGQKDIAENRIRCVGNPSTRFQEDALRILRALRFAAQLGFQVEEQTAKAIHENRALLCQISPERIFGELRQLLVGSAAGEVLRNFPDVIFVFIPELAPELGFWQNNPNHIHDIWVHTTMAVDAITPDPVLRMTMLLHDVGKAEKYFTDEAGVGHFYGHAEAGAIHAEVILRRLRCGSSARQEIVQLISYHDIEPPQTEKSVRRLIMKLGGEIQLRHLIACWRADSDDRADTVRERNLRVISGTEAVLAEILARESCFSLRDLAVDGNDILSLGLVEGPEVGCILRTLFRMVTEENIPNEREKLLVLAREMIEKI